MSVVRLVLILTAALAVLLTIVTLRAEATRLDFHTSEVERRTQARMREIREQELELARLRNPSTIRERVAELRLSGTAEGAAPATQPAKPKKGDR